MWIFSKYGFYSSVCATQGRGGPVDPERIVVRARERGHLERLKEHFPGPIGDAEILDHAGTDYPYRIVVRKDAWTTVCTELAHELDYTNFKDAVWQDQRDSNYEHALHKVWRTMYGLERGET